MPVRCIGSNEHCGSLGAEAHGTVKIKAISRSHDWSRAIPYADVGCRLQTDAFAVVSRITNTNHDCRSGALTDVW